MTETISIAELLTRVDRIHQVVRTVIAEVRELHGALPDDDSTLGELRLEFLQVLEALELADVHVKADANIPRDALPVLAAWQTGEDDDPYFWPVANGRALTRIDAHDNGEEHVTL